MIRRGYRERFLGWKLLLPPPPNLAAAYPERAAALHLVGKENVDVVEKAAALHLFGKQNADVPAEYP